MTRLHLHGWLRAAVLGANDGRLDRKLDRRCGGSGRDAKRFLNCRCCGPAVLADLPLEFRLGLFIIWFKAFLFFAPSSSMATHQ